MRGVAVGYQSLFERVWLSDKELGHHGLVLGAPGSGKTTFLALLAQGHARLGPVIIIDGKGSRVLREAVEALPNGKVWTIGGSLKLDLLDPDPTILADQLTEAARHEGPSEVYSEAAARLVQWAGHVLRWQGKTPTLELIEVLLAPGTLAKVLARYRTSKPRVPQWLDQLAAMSDVELSGMRTALMRVTRLLDSAAGPSLGAGSDAARLEDVMGGRTTLLLSMDGRRYASLSRILIGWALVALQRACLAVGPKTQALLILDEVGSYGRAARLIEPLLALARDQNVGVVLAAHGPSQLDEAAHGLAGLVLQMTAWSIILAQGDPDDADRLSRLFPLDDSDAKHPVTLGRYAQGLPTVTRDHLMWLAPGDCCYRVRPIDRLEGRWGRARIALPRRLPEGTTEVTEGTEGMLITVSVSHSTATEATEGIEQLGPTSDEELRELVLQKMRLVGGWRVWRGNFDKDGYPRVWVPRLRVVQGQWKGGYVGVHRLVCAWEQGPIPRAHDVDHGCNLKECFDHLKARTAPDNRKLRWAREKGEEPTGHDGLTPPVRHLVSIERWAADPIEV